jgi:hypothetical protein
MPEFSNDILNVNEVAQELRCSKAHVYHAIKGTIPGLTPLPAITLGRRKLVRRSTLEKWKRFNERVPANAMIDPSLKNHAADA